MSAPWQTFRSTGSSHEVASLFAKYNFGSAGYTVLLTDLTYIWEESLDRKQIIKRALDLDTPIDPSEDGSQMQLLLRHVRESFEGRAGTSVTVSGRHDAGELNVNISVPLDSPLPPLQWPLYLARAAQSVFTAEFVMPNLRICSLAHAQINSLLQHLTEKDNIIDKLTEKLQSDGNGLSNLFPGASVSRTGSKLNPRQTVGKSVKGFSAFDEKQWREQIPPSFDSNEDIDMIVSTVFDSDIAPLSNPGQRFSNHSRLQLTNFDQAKSTEGMTEVPTSGLEARNPESTFDSFQVRFASSYRPILYGNQRLTSYRDNLRRRDRIRQQSRVPSTARASFNRKKEGISKMTIALRTKVTKTSRVRSMKSAIPLTRILQSRESQVATQRSRLVFLKKTATTPGHIQQTVRCPLIQPRTTVPTERRPWANRLRRLLLGPGPVDQGQNKSSEKLVVREMQILPIAKTLVETTRKVFPTCLPTRGLGHRSQLYWQR